MDAVRGTFAQNTNATPHRTPPGLASHYRGTAQENRPSDGLDILLTRCESIETTLRTKILLWGGALIRMCGGWLPKRIVFGNLEGAVRRGRGGKEKSGPICVQSDIRAFVIARD